MCTSSLRLCFNVPVPTPHYCVSIWVCSLGGINALVRTEYSVNHGRAKRAVPRPRSFLLAHEHTLTLSSVFSADPLGIRPENMPSHAGKCHCYTIQTHSVRHAENQMQQMLRYAARYPMSWCCRQCSRVRVLLADVGSRWAVGSHDRYVSRATRLLRISP